MSKLIAIVAASFLASGAVAFAAQQTGATQGQNQTQGATPGATQNAPGASEYAPGQQMKEHRSTEPGHHAKKHRTRHHSKMQKSDHD